jgi:hypothetical protein
MALKNKLELPVEGLPAFVKYSFILRFNSEWKEWEELENFGIVMYLNSESKCTLSGAQSEH